ncbi:MAG: hypothetical protein PUJ21_04910 [Clostridia bacterium]|nr:hypothetical protein [Clostridia bacterium]MDY6184766.1 hypothetical protein [Eubacteriales bacterium]
MSTTQDFIAQPGPIQPDKCRTDDRQPLPPLQEILKRPRAERPIYGIYSWFIDYPTYGKAIREIGFPNIRSGGPFTDEEFSMMIKDGLDIQLTIGQALSKFENEDAFIQGNIDRALELLRRYGPGGAFFKEHPELPYHPIEHLEIYNEPNFQYMVPNDTDIKEKARLYTRLQTAVYPAVKAEFPTVKILGFGAGGASAADVGFIDLCCKLDPAIYDTMDILSTHPYIDPISPFLWKSWLKFSVASGLQNIKAILARGGKEDMPIWYTELGWFIRPDAGGFYDACHDALDQVEHAAFNVQMYALGMRLGVERIETMYIMDTDKCNAGFVNRDGSFRVAAEATKVMISLMPDPRLVGALLDGEDNQYAYVFEAQPGGEEVTMVFHANAPATITIPWNEPTAKVTDMVGHTAEVKAENGHLTLSAGPCPLYIRHA